MDAQAFLASLTQAGLQLNPAQKEAVTCLRGPLQVIAGPGSGKTRVITARTAALLSAGVDPGEIVVLTFTKAAAQEMQERVASLPGLRAGQVRRVTMGTFHALCYRLLRQFRSEPRLISGKQQRRIVERALLDAGEELKNDLVDEMLAAISSAKNRRMSLGDLARRESLLRAVWGKYEDAKTAAGLMDYDDLLLEACNLLETDGQLLQRLQQRFQYIMVDEFQDTNPVQYQLVQHLAAPQGNLCVVGDIDQAIYAWRAASPELLLQFPKDYPGARIIELKQNYRSTPAIVGVANRLISHNKQRHQLTVESVRTGGAPPILLQPTHEWAEAKSVLTMLQKAREKGVPLSEMAVLYRTNNQARPLVSLLVEQDIPFTLRDSGQLGLDHWAVQESHAFLRLLVDTNDLNSFLQVGRRQLKLTDEVAARIRNICERQSVTPWQAVRKLPVGSVELVKVQQLVQHLAHACRLSPDQALGYYLRKMGVSAYLEWYAEHRGFEGGTFVGVVEDLRLDIRRFDSIAAYLQHLDKVIDTVSSQQPAGDALNLMTLHGAKGLEFQIVWIIDAIVGLLPHSLSQTPEQQEEERRLFYVGCTRAKDQLYLLSPLLHRGKETEQSPFVEEALGPQAKQQQAGVLSVTAHARTAAGQPKPSAVTGSLGTLASIAGDRPTVGMAVIHNSLGHGEIMACDVEISGAQQFNVVTVDFPTRAGVKLHWELSVGQGFLRKA